MYMCAVRRGIVNLRMRTKVDRNIDVVCQANQKTHEIEQKNRSIALPTALKRQHYGQKAPKKPKRKADAGRTDIPAGSA